MMFSDFSNMILYLCIESFFIVVIISLTVALTHLNKKLILLT